MKKKTIARKTLLPVLFCFAVLLGIFFFSSFRFIRGFLTDDRQATLEAMVDNFDRVARKEAEDGNLSTETELRKFLLAYGDDLCESYDIDYFSAFTPYFDTVEIEYFTVSNRKELEDAPGVQDAKRAEGRIVRYRISEEFRKVWNGEKRISTIEYDNEYGHELCSFVKITPPCGKELIVTLEYSMNGIYAVTDGLFRSLFLAVAVIFLLSLLAIGLSLRENVTKPAGAVSEAMNRFITDGARSGVRITEEYKGEFGTIGGAFNRMADHIDAYIDDISALRSSEERQKAEMDIASKIQSGFLPLPESHFSGCDIYACMRPAADIGGDLYDYLKLDEDRMLIMIADVSGKGISAAIFMVAAITLMHEFAKMNLGPAEILERTNRSLTEKNPQLLFVTAFVGIYNNRTLEFTYSNGGHNTPYLLSGGAKPLEGSHGTILGLFSDETYTQMSVKLLPGDILYLYTDGVNESVDKNEKLFGDRKLSELLSAFRPSYTENLVNYVNHALESFSEGALQHDDITMLSLTAKEKTDVLLPADCAKFPEVKKLIFESRIPEEIKMPLCVAAEEIFINICSYAYEKNPSEENRVHVFLSLSDHTELRFEDNGVPYDPREGAIESSEDYDMDTQIGGLGKLIAFTIADDVRYEYKENRNILTLIKYQGERFS